MGQFSVHSPTSEQSLVSSSEEKPMKIPDLRDFLPPNISLPDFSDAEETRFCDTVNLGASSSDDEDSETEFR